MGKNLLMCIVLKELLYLNVFLKIVYEYNGGEY